jgi:hypothetical protein
MQNFGEQFLHQKDQKLHTSGPVEHEQERLKRERKGKQEGEEKGEKISSKPADKITDWLKVIEQTHLEHRNDPEVMERLKEHYHKEYVIKPEDVPESTFLLEQRIAREMGYGTIEITDEFRKEKTNQIIAGQEQSLDKWLDYLSSPDADYPTWAKYWAFKSMLAMGKFEKKEENGKEVGQFKKRTKDTVASFPPMNPRALAMTISAIVAKAEENTKKKEERGTIKNLSVKLGDLEFKNLLTTENFSKIYAQFLMEMPEYSTEGLKETRGKWVKYEQDSTPDELVKSLEGYPLEWCTANIDTARTQLQGGDFYVYYSLNDQGEAVIPRLAIRMEGDRIGEVRGIAHDQNLDPYISDVAREKLDTFPDGKQYEKKVADMKRLTEIEEKTKQNTSLNKDDLRFLYEIDEKIDGFGYERDPRIQEMIEKRDLKSDLSLATGFSKEEISITKDEALRGGIKYHYGDLNLRSLASAEGLVLPETIGGYLDLGSLTSAEGLILPETIGSSLDLEGLTSAEGLVLPETIGGYLDLNSLTSAEGLVLPKTIGGRLDLRGLTSAEGLTLPKTIGTYLNLGSLTSAEGLILPETIGSSLYLNSLTSAEKEVLRKKYSQLSIK